MPSTNIFYDAIKLTERLRQALQCLELSYRQAAEEIGVACPTLYRVAQGAVPDVENYLRIEHWLKSVHGLVVNRRTVLPLTIASVQRRPL